MRSDMAWVGLPRRYRDKDTEPLIPYGKFGWSIVSPEVAENMTSRTIETAQSMTQSAQRQIAKALVELERKFRPYMRQIDVISVEGVSALREGLTARFVEAKDKVRDMEDQVVKNCQMVEGSRIRFERLIGELEKKVARLEGRRRRVAGGQPPGGDDQLGVGEQR
jgi:hypothetical protein